MCGFISGPFLDGPVARCPLGSVLSAFVQGTSPNSLRDLWRTSGQATGFCPPLTAYVRLWPPAAGQASSALGGAGALLSAVGQGGGFAVVGRLTWDPRSINGGNGVAAVT